MIRLKKQRKSEMLQIRVTPDFKKRLAKYAASAEMSMGTYLIMQAMSADPSLRLKENQNAR